MSNPAGKYEAEIRLALVLIVGLLLVLNTSTAYLLYRVKQDLTADLDRRITTGLELVKRHLEDGEDNDRTISRQDYIRQEAGLSRIRVIPTDGSRVKAKTGTTYETLAKSVPMVEIDSSSIGQLMRGQSLYRFDQSKRTRLGLTMAGTNHGRSAIVVVEADARIIGQIGSAAYTALYMASGIMAFIVVLMIVLPRYILRPFKILHDQARLAGKLSRTDSSDEVTDVISSYEHIIDELQNNEKELARLYRESSTRANRLERLNEYILKSIRSGVINVDLTGTVIGFNRAAGDILGLDPRKIIGTNYLVGFSTNGELELIISSGLERGDVVRTREIEFEREDGEFRWLGVESSIIYDDRDRVVGITLVLADMTELKRMQSELETNRQLAALGEMTGGLAHQLRNSLAAISGFCQLLQKKASHEASLADVAESIRSEAAASESMVNRFLNFAKPLRLTTDAIDIGELLEECRQKWSAEAAGNGVTIRLLRSREGITAIGDRLFLKEALGNVIDNAIQAAGAGGEVLISLQAVETHVEIIISDTGPGIPDSMRERLFTPFVSSKPSGTGLGLALTGKIISLHKGTISFDSPSDGGTVCSIRIPLCKDSGIDEPAATADTGKNL